MTGPVSNRVIRNVARETDTSPPELPALFETVNPDALESIVRSADGQVTVEFEYGGCTVRVDSQRGVSVR